MKEQSLKKAMESFEIESKAIANIADYLDVSAFKRLLKYCTCNKIITCASGTSGIAAKKMAHSLCCVERDAFSCHLQQQFMVALAPLRKTMP